VTIGYSEVLRYVDGLVRFTFPSKITPRYNPSAGAGAEGPIPATGTPSGPVSVLLDLDAGFPVAAFNPPPHGKRFRLSNENAWRGEFSARQARGDVVFEWTAQQRDEPYAALLHETFGDEQYALLMVTPPRAPQKKGPRTPRQTTFIIDTSGSMNGEPIEQARAALLDGIERLRPGDRFNIVEFNSNATALFDAPAAVNSTNLSRARQFINGLHDGGGTEMLGALDLAFRLDTSDFQGLRQHVFITDGAVSNEAGLFDAIRARLEDRRLFTVGIGRAPNTHFMTKAAEFGRGTFTFIAEASEVKDKMSGLFARIGEPQLTDLDVDFGAPAEIYPPRLPDVYAGEPILVAAKLKELGGRVTLRGKRGDRDWARTIPLAGASQGDAVHRVWAHRKVSALTAASRAYADGSNRHHIVQTALFHGIVTAHTSLVAVEERPQVARAALPRTATPALLFLLLGAPLATAGALGLRRRRRA
jgi:Ca-activated chloride channel family protein